jgi:FtsP/CotA-like multicopper oxidase with cupredoxin domain
MTVLSRREVLLGGLGLAGTAVLAGCTGTATSPPPARTFGTPPSAAPTAGQRVVTATLTPRPATLDLGGPVVTTWAYGDTAPGAPLRATAGDLLRVTVDNQLPADTTVHWHGIRLHNQADGVPGVTQDPIRPGTAYTYEFTAPDPGTYFFHPHVGVQLDRGLYAPLIIDDPAEPGAYDAEWVIVLDDWVDGTGRTPDQVLAQLIADGGPAREGLSGMGGMGGPMMDHAGMGLPPFGDSGDVTYPLFLVNGRIPAAPVTLTAKPRQRVRMRIVNAAADTIFAVALGGHRLTVTHTDGYAVAPRETSALYIGMGERYDVTATLADGVFPLVAAPFGKQGQGMALVRTGSGTAPAPDVRVPELTGDPLLGSDLQPAAGSRLPTREPDATEPLTLAGSMKPYLWGINGAPYGQNTPITVQSGQRLRLTVSNMTMMTHPIHLHGHTFALASSGLRKDTVLVRPMETMPIDVEADNAGDWMTHCHNIYHAEAGMMIVLSYTA